ncbi:MAG: tripartite tricarboxylate transporter TctB family protein [Armatimonadota bacterium]|nr:tripartite tricarboxylate transporter TctB family protein [Armatimonadota bacterium]
MALLLLAGSILLAQEALRLPVAWTTTGPGSGFFPLALSVGMAFNAALILIKSLRVPLNPGAPFIPVAARRPLLIVSLPIVAVLALMNVLGIYLGGAIYLAGYMRLVGHHRWSQVALVAVGIPLALFLLFERWFLLPLPKGSVLELLLYGR